MNIDRLTIEPPELRKLLLCGSTDAVMLYLYLRVGNSQQSAAGELRMSQSQVNCAAALLRQLGLTADTKPVIHPGERPSYTEDDVLKAMDSDSDFRSLYGEVQRLLGKVLNTEELKILLGFTRYLGLSADVISVLVCYCKERNRQRGSSRNPSLRTIEKEAYAWAEQGIDTLEEAAAFIQHRNLRNSRLQKLMDTIQIRGRNLTPGEERYAQSWLDMGFDMDAIAMAYERTCLNTGGLSWAYMNKILTRWHEAGLHTADAVRTGDRKPTTPNGAAGELGEREIAAIRRLMQEG
ncbi:MAG: DnaD domain protein [Oscillospiraceae bacterium]|nr:DnaD domain protein [Oscillospiraceae bacterium]